jgi:hypothetical protein
MSYTCDPSDGRLAAFPFPLRNRPNGNPDPRMGSLDRNDRVAIRDSMKGWYFIFRTTKGDNLTGWVQKKDLYNCTPMERTP